jgi:hypothetical protein
MQGPMRVFLALVVITSGCLPVIDVPPPPTCDVSDAGTSTPRGRSVLVGEPALVIISRSAAECPVVVDGVAVQARVTDAQQRPLVADVAGPFSRGRFVSAEVRFTPTFPGVYGIEATFDPGLGTGTNQVVAVRSVSPGPVLGTLPSSVPCVSEGLTSRGTWLCFSEVQGRGQVAVWRSGQALQALSATGFQVVGDTVWVFNRGGLERFVDRGGDFLARDPDRVLGVDEVPQVTGQLVALDERRVLRVRDGVVDVLTLAGARLDRSEELMVPKGLCAAAARWTADRLGALALACGSREGFVRLCVGTFADPSALRCREVAGRVVGADLQGGWVQDRSTLSRITPNAVTSMVVPEGWQVTASRRVNGSLSPLLTEGSGRVMLPSIVDGQVVLSTLDPASRLTVVGAGEGLLVADGAEQRNFLRAPEP